MLNEADEAKVDSPPASAATDQEKQEANQDAENNEHAIEAESPALS